MESTRPLEIRFVVTKQGSLFLQKFFKELITFFTKIVYILRYILVDSNLLFICEIQNGFSWHFKGDILANFIIREDTKANGKCRLTASLNNPLPLIVHVFSGIRKGNPYSKIMNQWYCSLYIFLTI